MSSKYKAVVIDIDGTLIPNSVDGKPSSEVTEAIKEVQKVAKVIIATGRSSLESHRIIQELYDNTPYIYINGACVEIPFRKETLISHQLSPQQVSNIYELVNMYDLCAFTNEGTVSISSDPSYKSKHKVIAPNNLETIFNIEIKRVSETELKKVIEELKSQKDINIGWTQSGDNRYFDIEVTDSKANKGKALEQILDNYDIKLEECVAIGDGGNDLPLFEVCGLSIAMGNATDDVKNNADRIGPSAEDNGVAKILTELFLSDK